MLGRCGGGVAEFRARSARSHSSCPFGPTQAVPNALIQALDRTQKGLPINTVHLGTMTHDYKRNGTITLFAASNVAEGFVIEACMSRHRH